MDDDMYQLIDSIKEQGLITPLLLRPKEDGRYEIVSGHRRKTACEIAGLSYVKADVREMTRDEAIVLMVEANLQRAVILPSEKAFSYKMRLDAIKRMPGRPKSNYSPSENNSEGTSSAAMAEDVGESAATIFRYIRLTELIPELLDLVDEGKIAVRPAVELSYLSREEQESVFRQISESNSMPSQEQAASMREFSKNGSLNADRINEVMHGDKPKRKEKVHIDLDKIRNTAPDVTKDNAEAYVLQALEYYVKHRAKSKAATK
jgi:ParB family chromosome partitioning protein